MGVLWFAVCFMAVMASALLPTESKLTKMAEVESRASPEHLQEMKELYVANPSKYKLLNEKALKNLKADTTMAKKYKMMKNLKAASAAKAHSVKHLKPKQKKGMLKKLIDQQTKGKLKKISSKKTALPKSVGKPATAGAGVATKRGGSRSGSSRSSGRRSWFSSRRRRRRSSRRSYTSTSASSCTCAALALYEKSRCCTTRSLCC